MTRTERERLREAYPVRRLTADERVELDDLLSPAIGRATPAEQRRAAELLAKARAAADGGRR